MASTNGTGLGQLLGVTEEAVLTSGDWGFDTATPHGINLIEEQLITGGASTDVWGLVQ